MKVRNNLIFSLLAFTLAVGSCADGPKEDGTLTFIDNGTSKVTVCHVEKKIQVFDAQGNFQKAIDLKRNLNKPKMQMTEKGNLTLVHLAFFRENDTEKQFLALHGHGDDRLLQTPRQAFEGRR